MKFLTFGVKAMAYGGEFMLFLFLGFDSIFCFNYLHEFLQAWNHSQ